MAGLRGNQAWLLAAKQSAKGTVPVPATSNAFKMPFSGGNIAPVRETDNLSETDSSRDRGIAYVTTSGVEGTPEFYVRDDSIPFWLYACLGSIASTGTTNYTHTITPGGTLPYIAVWRDIADTLYEEFRDCKVSSMTISAQAGAPLVASVGIQGLQATRLTAAPDTVPVALQSGPVYSYNDATVTLSGGATALVGSFELTIENGVTRQQTDAVVPYDVVEGVREVSLTFDLIFETLTEYNQFHYGGASGTAISSSIYETAAIFTFTKGANNEISFSLPHLAYTEFPVEPNPGGDPIVASVAAAAQRFTGSPVVTATVKNQHASY